MKGCLNEERLYALYKNESDSADRAHVESCPECAAKLKALAADLDLISNALLNSPPPRRAHRPRLAFPGLAFQGWALAAAAVLTVSFMVGRWSSENTHQAQRPMQVTAVEKNPSSPWSAGDVALLPVESDDDSIGSESYVGYLSDAFSGGDTDVLGGNS